MGHAPPGTEAKVIDGYVRLWLRVSPTETVVVLDYRGAPYLRFVPAGVEVNQNSVMWYLNQTPVAGSPPAGLSARTPAHWYRVSAGHEYEWHDGRLQGLTAVALAPGTSYVGMWRVPLLLDGRPATVSGGLWHADAPSPVWFWPILVLIACVLAAWRIRRPELDRRVAAALGSVAVTSEVVAAIGRGLHGRPGLDLLALIELAGVLAFAAWALRSVVTRRPSYFTYLLIAIVGLWEGLDLLPVLLHHYVLIALPPFVARTATVMCLGASVGILVLVFRLAEIASPGSLRSEASPKHDRGRAPTRPGPSACHLSPGPRELADTRPRGRPPRRRRDFPSAAIVPNAATIITAIRARSLP